MLDELFTDPTEIRKVFEWWHIPLQKIIASGQVCHFETIGLLLQSVPKFGSILPFERNENQTFHLCNKVK